MTHDNDQARIAELEATIEKLKSEIALLDPWYGLKQTLPDENQALALFHLITNKYPRMRSPSDSEHEQALGLRAAMGFVFSLTKTAEPCTKFDGSWWTSKATMFASNARLFAPRIRSLLIGIIAANDIDWTLDNGSIWLDAFGTRGKSINTDRWKLLLNGGPLREPTRIEAKRFDASIGFRREIAPSW